MANPWHFWSTAAILSYYFNYVTVFTILGIILGCAADELIVDIPDPIEVSCDATFGVSDPSSQNDGIPLYVPYCSNNVDLSPSGNKQARYKQVIIIIHGNARNADEALLVVQQASNRFFSNDDKDKIAMIAPQFLIDVDIDALGLEQSDPQFLYWSSPGWKKGNASQKVTYDRPFTISSFAVVDQMIQQMLLQFPNVDDITLLGNSAGGQFVQRFAAGGNSYASHVRLWYIFSNLSSYMYFSNKRPELEDPTRFSTPSKPSHLFELSECPTYDDYRYGINELNVYMEDVGVDQLRENYASRNIILLIGENDTEDNFMLDTSCSAMLQGENRYQRAVQFYHHTVQEFGESVQERHKFVIIPGIGHEATDMYQSLCGQSILFGPKDWNDNLYESGCLKMVVEQEYTFSEGGNSGKNNENKNHQSQSQPRKSKSKSPKSGTESHPTHTRRIIKARSK